jgi:hypothetical protein
MPFIRRRHADANASPKRDVLTRPVPEEPGAFRQGRIIGDFVVLDWATGHGLSAGRTPSRRPARQHTG